MTTYAASRPRVRTVLNLEMALTDEMLAIATTLQPYQVTFVPERREEITTEGGLDVARDPRALRAGIERMKRAGIPYQSVHRPDGDAVRRSHDLGADAVELHTGRYAHAPHEARPIDALRNRREVGG